MKHTDKPQPSPESEQTLQNEAEKLQRSEYARYLEPLQAAVQGKKVVSSRAGKSGFLLAFADGSWVATYLVADRLTYELGIGTPTAANLAQLSSPSAGDASAPLTYNRPYAGGPCDIPIQVAHSHGHAIEGLACGAACFNFCFPSGMELDTSIVTDPEGRKALRVFWEQW